MAKTGRLKAPDALHERARNIDPKVPRMLGLTGLETASLSLIVESEYSGWNRIPNNPWFPTDLRFVELRLTQSGSHFRLTPLGRFAVIGLRALLERT